MEPDDSQAELEKEDLALTQVRVAAVLVALNPSSGPREDSAPGPTPEEVLGALERQSFALDRIVVVTQEEAWDDALGVGADAGPAPLRVVAAEDARNFGQAVHRALQADPDLGGFDWLWLIHDDLVPEPDALAHLLEAAAGSRTIAMVGPKQVLHGHTDQLLEVGIEATATARRVNRLEPGEIDQGQHDGREDVLAVGTAGALIRPAVLLASGGFDPALGPFGDGLELGRRLWLSGNRVVVAPRAVVQHERRSHGAGAGERASYARRRTAQLYNWCLAVPGWQLPLLVVWLPVWTLIRSIGRLFTRHPGMVFAEWSAYFGLVAKSGALIRARRRLKEAARSPRSALRGLEASPATITQLRRSNRKIAARGTEKHVALDSAALGALRKHRLRTALIFWALIAAVTILSVVVWHPYVSGLTGGSWGALPSTWTELAAQAWSGWQVSGDGLAGPAAPLLTVVALLSAPFALIGVQPPTFALLLVFLALPLATWAGWGVASSFTRSPWIRAAGALLWAGSAPLLVAGLGEGELALVLAYLSLPVLVTGLVRFFWPAPSMRAEGVEDVIATSQPARWSWLGLAGLAAVVLTAAAPLGVVLASLLAVLVARGSGAVLGRKLWAVAVVSVPGLVLILPSLWAAIAHGTWSSFSDWVAAPLVDASILTPLVGVPAFDSSLLPTWALVAGCLSGGVLVLWSLVVAVASSLRPSQPSAPAYFWLAGALAAAVFALQAQLWPGGGAGSGILLGSAAALWLASIGAAYPRYRVVAGALLLPGDAARERIKQQRARQTVPGIVASVAGFASIVGLLLLGPVGVLSQGTAEESAGGEQFVSPSPSPVIPVIAQEAQNGSRKARLLTLKMTGGVVEAGLLRGPGVQLADLTGAPVSSSQSEIQSAAQGSLATVVATLTSVPSTVAAETLKAHGVDLIQLSDQSEQAEEIREILDATPGLQKIGAVSGAQLWRVRPEGLSPSRVLLVSAAGETEVDSGYVNVKTQVNVEQANTVLVLSEVADPYWRATFQGVSLEATTDPSSDQGWRQAFLIPQGTGTLLVYYAPPYLNWWRIGFGVALAAVALLALPRGIRKQRLEPVEVKDLG